MGPFILGDVTGSRQELGQVLGSKNSVPGTANLRTKILAFRVFDSSIVLVVKGWNSHTHREFPGKFEASNLSRDNLSREMGRRGSRQCYRPRSGAVACPAWRASRSPASKQRSLSGVCGGSKQRSLSGVFVAC